VRDEIGRLGTDVVVRDLVRRAPGGRVVLDRLTTTFPAGQVTVVHGANGSGKSMLSRVLAGVDRPDAGAISTGRTAAFLLPERAAVLPGCSARSLGAALVRTTGARAGWPDRLDDALDRMRSTHGGRARMHQLSKGNLQKAYLAIAYALRPALAVLDEPLSGLDAEATTAATALMRELAGEGCVVVVTAHRAMRVADLNWALVAGRLANPTKIVDDDAYLVDLAPAGPARELVEARSLGQVVGGGASAPQRAQVRVAAGGLDALLRTALAHDLEITRVVQDGQT
jgi:ABC-type Mn2+/Zn2+ transport system ATPase subunit